MNKPKDWRGPTHVEGDSWSLTAEIDRERENEAWAHQWRHDRDDFVDWLRDGKFERVLAVKDGRKPMTVADFCSEHICNDGVFPFSSLLKMLNVSHSQLLYVLQDRIVEYIAGKYADAVAG